jgi:AP-3 complex subunit mu
MLRDNFDTVHQLLEETSRCRQAPADHLSDALREIVLPPSLITKILSVIGIQGSLRTV